MSCFTCKQSGKQCIQFRNLYDQAILNPSASSEFTTESSCSNQTPFVSHRCEVIMATTYSEPSDTFSMVELMMESL